MHISGAACLHARHVFVHWMANVTRCTAGTPASYADASHAVHYCIGAASACEANATDCTACDSMTVHRHQTVQCNRQTQHWRAGYL